jgi:biopolymer transport protein ExbB
MLFIGLLSLALVYLFVERLLTINKAAKINPSLLSGVRNLLASGNIEGAKNLCKSSTDPVAKMIEKGISRLGQPIQEIESAMETAGKVELNKIEKNMGYLSTIAAIAPMLGFVGTIFGVITIFYNISQSGDFGIQTISEGLYQKMVTSAAGLIVGILAFIAHHLLHNKIERLVSVMEESAMQFIDIISEPGK